MSNRPYAACEIKDVDVEKLRQQFGESSVAVGVDIAKEMVFACLMGLHWSNYFIVKFNLRNELGSFVELLSALQARETHVIWEPSGVYGDPLRASLESEEGIELFKMRPHKVGAASELFDDVPSLHDGKAAWLLARLHRYEVSEQWRNLSEERRAVRARLDEVERREKNLDRLASDLERWLGRHWLEVTQYLKLKSATLLALLEKFGSAQAVARQPEVAHQYMRKISRGKLSETKIRAVLDAARNTHGVVPVEAEREQVQSIASDMRRLKKELSDRESRLKSSSESDRTIHGLKGLGGLRLGCALVVLLGDPVDYGSAYQYEKGAGLNLKERSSGRHKGELKITKRGPGRVRKYLYLFACRMIQRENGCPCVRAYYLERMRRNGNCSLKALTAVMRKLIKALYHVGRGAEYEPAKLFDTKSIRLEG